MRQAERHERHGSCLWRCSAPRDQGIPYHHPAPASPPPPRSLPCPLCFPDDRQATVNSNVLRLSRDALRPAGLALPAADAGDAAATAQHRPLFQLDSPDSPAMFGYRTHLQQQRQAQVGGQGVRVRVGVRRCFRLPLSGARAWPFKPHSTQNVHNHAFHEFEPAVCGGTTGSAVSSACGTPAQADCTTPTPQRLPPWPLLAAHRTAPHTSAPLQGAGGAAPFRSSGGSRDWDWEAAAAASSFSSAGARGGPGAGGGGGAAAGGDYRSGRAPQTA